MPYEPFVHTHFAGCVVLFNKDTFHSDIQVNSVYIHDTNGQQQVAKEDQSGRVPQVVISCASFRRISPNGKSYSAIMSLHINNQHAEKRVTGKNLLLTVRTVMRQEQVDMWQETSMVGHCDDSQALNIGTLAPLRRGLCQHVLTNSTGPHTFVETRWRTRRLG